MTSTEIPQTFICSQATAAALSGHSASWLRDQSCTRLESGKYDAREVIRFAIEKACAKDRAAEEKRLRADIKVLQERLTRYGQSQIDVINVANTRSLLLEVVERLLSLADEFEQRGEAIAGSDAQAKVNGRVEGFMRDLKKEEEANGTA